jgi:hypothetical protein
MLPNEDTPMITRDQVVYNHEVGTSMPDYDDVVWAETHVVNYQMGSAEMTIKQLLPEIIGDPTGIQFAIAKRSARLPDRETYTGLRNVRSNGYVDIRETARDFRIRVECGAAGGWSLGTIGVEGVARGRGVGQ